MYLNTFVAKYDSTVLATEPVLELILRYNCERSSNSLGIKIDFLRPYISGDVYLTDSFAFISVFNVLDIGASSSLSLELLSTDSMSLLSRRLNVSIAFKRNQEIKFGIN